MSNNPLSRRTVTASLLAATALVAVAPARAEQKVLKLGSIGTTSGPNASMGKEGLNGLQYEIKKINDAGGAKIGNDTYRLELINVDDESKPEKAVAAAERLINSDKVRFIFGPPASTTTLAILPTTEQAGVLTITYIAVAPNIIAPNLKLSFRTGQSSLQSVAPSVKFAQDKGAKSIAYLGRNDDWGRSAGKALRAGCDAAGIKLTVEEYFDPGTTDFYGLLTKVKSAAPDMVLASTIIEDGVPLVKQYRELRLKQDLLNLGSIWSSPNFLKAAGKAAEGTFVMTGPQTNPRPQIKAFDADYLKATGIVSQTFDKSGADAVQILVAAMQKAKSVEPNDVAAALRTLVLDGIMQDYAFHDANATDMTMNVNEIKDGALVLISSIRAPA